MSTKILDKIDWTKKKKKPTKIHTTLWLSPDVLNEIRRLAKKYKVRNSVFVEKILRKTLEV
jgi:hypothetical protein